MRIPTTTLTLAAAVSLGLAVAALRLRWNAVLQAVGRGMLAPDRRLADRCPFPQEVLPSGGTTGSPP